MCGLNSTGMLDALPVQKEKYFALPCNVLFWYKGNCKGNQKEDVNVESCTRVNAHTRGKQHIFCTCINATSTGFLICCSC
jgi:hypothetical protein